MHSTNWAIIAETQPADPKAAQQESRWLTLGDDALHNRNNHSDDGKLLKPGSSAVGDFEREKRELQRAVRNLIRGNKIAAIEHSSQR